MIPVAGLVSAQVDDTTVIMNVGTGTYFGLEGTGLLIWQLLGEPTSVGDVIDTLVAEYGVPRHVCAPDVVKFLMQLDELGLIQLVL